MKKKIPGFQHAVGLLMVALLALIESACTPSVEKLWVFPVGSPIYSTPLVVSDLVIFGSENGTLHAVDKLGQARWRFQAPSAEIFAHPQTDGKLIFFGATNQTFYAVNLNGQLEWKFTARERIKSDPAVVEGVVYASSYDGHVYALDAGTGNKIWQFPPENIPEAKSEAKEEKKEEKKQEQVSATEQPLDPKPEAFSYSSPFIRDGVLYIGNLDGYLYALLTAEGKMKWRYRTDGGITSTPCVENGVVYVGSKDDHVYAIEADTGQKLIWKFKTGGDVLSSPKTADGVLYIGSNDKNFYALNAKTGDEKCHFTTKGPVIGKGVVYQDLVFFGGGQEDGNIYAILRNDCTLFFSSKTGYKIESDPTLDGDRLYITSGDRRLYAFKINRPAD